MRTLKPYNIITKISKPILRAIVTLLNIACLPSGWTVLRTHLKYI